MRLETSLHGLKHALKVWFRFIPHRFAKAGMKEMEIDPFLFHKHRGISICYVDDLSVFAKTNEHIQELKSKLLKELIINDLGMPRSFLGVDTSWPKNAVHLNQKTVI